MKKKTKLLSRKSYEEWLKKQPNKCQFCDWKENQIVLKEFRNWIWIYPISPYWKHHTMLITKKHKVEMSDLSVDEFKEMKKIYKHIMKKYGQNNLNTSFGKNTNQYVFFWRLRDYKKKIRERPHSEHFHIHIAPDKDNSWHPILDKEAHKFNIKKLK